MINKALKLGEFGCLFLVISLAAAVVVINWGNQGNNFGQRVHLGGTPSWAYALVGQVNGSPFLLALVTNQYGLSLAYASDGNHVAEWFQGPLDGTTVTLSSSDGSSFQATLTAQDAQGTLTLPGGSPRPFHLILTTGQAGLYRAKQEVNGIVYLAGWVLLADGRQAGVIESDTQQFMAAPRLDPAHPSIPLPDGGRLTPKLVTPDSDL